MKVNLLFVSAILSSAIFFSGCAASDFQAAIGNGSAVSTASLVLPKTNPNKVRLYFGNQGMSHHHKIIGHITASNYSIIGTPYSQSSIAVELKKQAASIGGTGVININTQIDRTVGDVVR